MGAGEGRRQVLQNLGRIGRRISQLLTDIGSRRRLPRVGVGGA
ncbi:hypothetical protein I552_1315 [Mycobacterium xenopi 3993]|nr:hypothetical protein I552_1315 [Mycobacterium xenopi 3993]